MRRMVPWTLSKMLSLLLFALTMSMCPRPVTMKGVVHTPIKNGVYKIINPQDGMVLTATQQGGRPGPKFVITDPWTGAPTQIWKVKTIPDVGLQILRNEEIRDNEVSKEEFGHSSESVEDSKKKFKMTEWNLVEQDDGMYEVNNGFGCLYAHGKGERITIDEDCDASHRWQFEFIGEITKK